MLKNSCVEKYCYPSSDSEGRYSNMSLDIYTVQEKRLCSITVDFSNATVTDLKLQVSKKTNIPLQRLSLRLEPGGKGLADGMPVTLLAHSVGKIYAKDLGHQIKWNNAFLLEYCGALIIYAFIYFRPNLIYNKRSIQKEHYHKEYTLYPFVLWSIHFTKRILETLYVHRFSHDMMTLKDVFRNCSYYWGFSLLIAYHVNHPLYTPNYNQAACVLGIFIFIVCELGNLSTHLLLRDLRPPGTNKRGIPLPNSNPLTRLFNYVSCPNYTYEFAAWVGFSLTVNCVYLTLFMFIGFIQMTVWAMEKHNRYVNEFPNYPKNRRFIVPFLV